MPAPFPKWADSLFRVLLAVGLITVAAVPLFLMAWVRTPQITGQFDPVRQPVEFDHRHHVDDDGIDCLYCHEQAERTPYAGIPPTERCLNCHSQIWRNSPLLEPVWQSYFSNAPIPWVRVHQLPDFVFFNHAIHVNKGVGCESCHGRVDQMARVYQQMPLTMGWCLECHRNPARFLRPREAMTVMGWQPPEPQEQLGRELMQQYGVQRLTNCTTCHR